MERKSIAFIAVKQTNYLSNDAQSQRNIRNFDSYTSELGKAISQGEYDTIIIGSRAGGPNGENNLTKTLSLIELAEKKGCKVVIVSATPFQLVDSLLDRNLDLMSEEERNEYMPNREKFGTLIADVVIGSVDHLFDRKIKDKNGYVKDMIIEALNQDINTEERVEQKKDFIANREQLSQSKKNSEQEEKIRRKKFF